jgi:hypothetical protein
VGRVTFAEEGIELDEAMDQFRRRSMKALIPLKY